MAATNEISVNGGGFIATRAMFDYYCNLKKKKDAEGFSFFSRCCFTLVLLTRVQLMCNVFVVIGELKSRHLSHTRSSYSYKCVPDVDWGRSFSSFSSFCSFCSHPASSAPLLLVPCRRWCLFRALLLFAGCGRVFAMASHHCFHWNHRAANCQDEGPVWGETAASLSSSHLLSSEAPPAGQSELFPRALFQR